MTYRISPLWLGIGISATLLAILFVVETALGRWDAIATEGTTNALARVSEGPLRDIRIAVVHCLVMGYVPAAFLQAIRNGRRAVLRLKEVLDCTDAECAELAASIRLSPMALAATTVAGLGIAMFLPYLVPPVPEGLWDPATWSPEVWWHRVLGPPVFALQLWLVYAVIIVSVRLSRVAERLKSIDLLDLSRLAPFTRLGLQNALLLFGVASIWSLMSIEVGVGKLMIFVGGNTLVVVAFAFIAPARGVNRRIRQAKDEELEWTNAAIRRLRQSLQSEDGPTSSGNVADLVAYRSMIEDVPEWPFTRTSYTRLFLYAFIPLLAWGVGVIAEEYVGRMLF